MEISENIGGFIIKNKENLKELNSTVYEMEHTKTKAKLLYLKNDDDIKTFGIGFRTPPENSCGVAHILEHCVLSGSRKYKTKEPFMDLLNSSMQVFLNAMTFPDKTIFPVSTRNEKDFFNLMDVYLDAVFYPNIYEEDKIFKQEGWHYELEDKNSEIKINGVVYNEMKGAYSDPEGQVYEHLANTLHQNSTYDLDSGGYPYAIPDLTYDEFLNFHKKFYHPSNSYIYLYGDLNIEKVLKYIDEEYLADFCYKDIDSSIKMNSPILNPQKITKYYSVGENDETKNKAYFSYSVCLGESSSSLDNFMRTILADALVNSDSSVLKNKLLETNIAEDYYAVTSSSLPLDLYIVAKNADENRFDEFISTIENNLKDVVENKIGRDIITASLTKAEYETKELGVHKGVILFIKSLNGWLYGLSPIEALKSEDSISYIKKNLENGFVENYIKEKITENNYKVMLLDLPKKGMFKKLDQKQKQDLKNLKENLSDEKLEKLISDTKALFEYQISEDSEEAKNTIPKLLIEDINPKIKKLNIKSENVGGTKFLHVDEFTDDISYVRLCFDLRNISKDELPYAGVVCDLIGSLDTENYNYKDLNNQIYIQTGGIDFSNLAINEFSSEKYTPLTILSAKAMPDKIDAMLDLIEELIFNTKFEDKKRIKDVLMIRKASIESGMEAAGHSIVNSEVSSMLFDSYDMQNILYGRKYYSFLKELIRIFDENSDEIIETLKSVYDRIFNQKLLLSFAGEKEIYEKIKDFTLEIKEDLSEFEPELDFKKTNVKSLALENSSNVVYCGEGFNYKDLNFKYDGSFAVLSQLLSGEYLHKNIRAKGGAYGAGIAIGKSGCISTYSYRDPNLDNTYKVYSEISKYLDGLDLKESEISNYIIASMATFDPPIVPSQYADIALSRFFSKIDENILEKFKAQAIKTDLSKIKSYAKMFKNASNLKVRSVFGSQEKIENAKTKFDVKIDLR